jgi:hypothetical protein
VGFKLCFPRSRFYFDAPVEQIGGGEDDNGRLKAPKQTPAQIIKEWKQLCDLV